MTAIPMLEGLVVHINYKLKTTDQAADFDEFEVSVVDMLLMKLWVNPDHEYCSYRQVFRNLL